MRIWVGAMLAAAQEGEAHAKAGVPRHELRSGCWCAPSPGPWSRRSLGSRVYVFVSGSCDEAREEEAGSWQMRCGVGRC